MNFETVTVYQILWYNGRTYHNMIKYDVEVYDE